MKYDPWMKAIIVDTFAFTFMCWPATRPVTMFFVLTLTSFALLSKFFISRIPDEAFVRLSSMKMFAYISSRFYLYHSLTDALAIALAVHFGYVVTAIFFAVNYIATGNLIARARRVFPPLNRKENS